VIETPNCFIASKLTEAQEQEVSALLLCVLYEHQALADQCCSLFERAVAGPRTPKIESELAQIKTAPEELRLRTITEVNAIAAACGLKEWEALPQPSFALRCDAGEGWWSRGGSNP